METLEVFHGKHFQTIGLTPPNGRLGHSLPTPRLLGKGSIFVTSQEPNNDNAREQTLPKRPEDLKIDLSHASKDHLQYSRRDPYVPPQSPLNQIRPPLFDVKILETFKEEWEGQEVDEQADIINLTERLVLGTEGSEKDELGRFKGDSLLSFSYKPFLSPQIGSGDELHGSFVAAFSHSMNSSLNLPFVTSPTKDKDQFLFPTVARNPNKALLTVDAKTSLILVANEVTCNLFGYQKSDLVGLKVQHLFTEPYQARQRALVEQNIDSLGETVLVSGKVMDAVTSYGLEFPVSVWMKKVAHSSSPDPRVVVVIEPVERCSVQFTLNEKGEIFFCDSGFAMLFGFDDDSEVLGKPLSSLIPSLDLPRPSLEDQNVPKQCLTGRTKDGSVFPLLVKFTGASLEPICQEATDKECRDDHEEGVTEGDSEEDPPSPLQEDPPSRVLTHGKVVVYAALSGMVCFNSDGSIEGCNHHFSLMLFGYSQKELLKKEITFLMPNFYSHLTDIEEESEEDENIPVHPLFEQEVEGGLGISQDPFKESRQEGSSDIFYSVSEKSISIEYGLDSHLASISEEDSEVFLSDNESLGALAGSSAIQSEDLLLINGGDNAVLEEDVRPDEEQEGQEVVIQFRPQVVTIGDRSYHYSCSSSRSSSEESLSDNELIPQRQLDNKKEKEEKQHSLTVQPLLTTAHDTGPQQEVPPLLSSTPCRPLSRPGSRLSSAPSRTAGYPEGTYMGKVRHKDGSLMTVVFELKQIVLRNDQHLYCMWITREVDCLVRDNSMASPDPSNKNQQGAADLLGSSLGIANAQEELKATEGEYSVVYETLGSIGRGAFGFVKLARRRGEDSMLVVVKFIKKATVISENWIDHEFMGRVPKEISLLSQLNHPNIVQLLEAYENEQYFQLVMEKHGDGMDLFSFIESCPALDEKLVSYLFRQIVCGLAYLHQKSILHRDVKDENIILDHHFHIKIIDFGSAVLMEDGKLFNTFCGTLEYCSPEVLLGNSYAGPELEMWSLGVTLYTLVYSENPFFDVEEIISGRLQPPHLVSPGLMKIILWLLHPDPVSRASLSDLQHDKWVNQDVDITQYSFKAVMEGGGKNKSLKYNKTISTESQPLQKSLINRTLS